MTTSCVISEFLFQFVVEKKARTHARTHKHMNIIGGDCKDVLQSERFFPAHRVFNKAVHLSADEHE